MPNSLRQLFIALPFKLRQEGKIKLMVWSFWLTLGRLLTSGFLTKTPVWCVAGL